MQTQIKVRGYHLDVYQHVNNARYLEFLEEARWDGLENSESFQWMTAHNIASEQPMVSTSASSITPSLTLSVSLQAPC